jgi:hypothetical protein
MSVSESYPTTRTSLHGVAELLLAGPAYRSAERIRLSVEPDGFATVEMDGPVRRLHVKGTDLVVDPGTDEGGSAPHSVHQHFPLVGTYAEVARDAGIDVGAPDLYSDHADVTADDEIVLDPDDVQVILGWFAAGDAALRAFAAGAGSTETPVLWPEHFDVAITLDEVNYGVSAGDAGIGTPYAYVGPWSTREGAFWNASFGATRTLEELGGADADALRAFFDEGRAAASD